MRSIVDRVHRLRQVDVKAEHFERQVQRLEQERDAWEKKFEVRTSLRLSMSSPHVVTGSARKVEEIPGRLG